MPLFVCKECGCLENTALCNYWFKEARGLPLTCSECDQKIGHWHGKFKKETPELGYAKRPDGFYKRTY